MNLATPANGSAASFRVIGASVAYGTDRALDGIDLTIDAGEAVALVGPSGAGKTTLLRLLNGSLRPTAGRITVNDNDLGDLGLRPLRRVRSSIALMHQHLGLVPNLRVAQNVISGRLGRLGLLGSLRAMLLPSRAMLLEAHRLLERVGIGHKLFERSDRLSGGQQQRAALARALFQEPSAILADEPVSSVDPARARDMVELLTRISVEGGLTLCVSLHNLELAREFFPRLVGLRAGRVVFDRPSAKVGEDQFRELFDLGAEELLEDGA